MQPTAFLQDVSRPLTRPLQAVNLQEQSGVSMLIQLWAPRLTKRLIESSTSGKF